MAKPTLIAHITITASLYKNTKHKTSCKPEKLASGKRYPTQKMITRSHNNEIFGTFPQYIPDFPLKNNLSNYNDPRRF